jgi:hypothetical protein
LPSTNAASVQTGGALVVPLLTVPRGGAWWRANRPIGFLPQYAAVINALLAKFTPAAGAAQPKTTARQPTESMPDSPAA